MLWFLVQVSFFCRCVDVENEIVVQLWLSRCILGVREILDVPSQWPAAHSSVKMTVCRCGCNLPATCSYTKQGACQVANRDRYYDEDFAGDNQDTAQYPLHEEEYPQGQPDNDYHLNDDRGSGNRINPQEINRGVERVLDKLVPSATPTMTDDLRESLRESTKDSFWRGHFDRSLVSKEDYLAGRAEVGEAVLSELYAVDSTHARNLHRKEKEFQAREEDLNGKITGLEQDIEERDNRIKLLSWIAGIAAVLAVIATIWAFVASSGDGVPEDPTEAQQRVVEQQQEIDDLNAGIKERDERIKEVEEEARKAADSSGNDQSREVQDLRDQVRDKDSEIRDLQREEARLKESVGNLENRVRDAENRPAATTTEKETVTETTTVTESAPAPAN